MTPKKTQPPAQSPFRSFWMAGYECTDKLNCFGNRVDFLEVTKHLDKLRDDYRLLSLLNIHTVREGIRWSKAEPSPYRYNWNDVRTMIEGAREFGIQQIWDLCHFGFPDDLSPLHPMFARRFAAFCRAFVRFYRTIEPDAVLIVTPINEVSFLAWLGGDVCGTSPYCRDYGWHVKYQLMKAYIEGIEAMKAEDPRVLIMPTEPLVNIVAPHGATTSAVEEAMRCNEYQFQVMDILTGQICPELRGKPEYLDIAGCNFYYTNQWEITTNAHLPWANENPDSRWKPLSSLLRELFERYSKPLVISETSHPKEDRPNWMDFVSTQCYSAFADGIPLLGICWYPVLDRPDWDHLQPWHHAGVWEVDISTPEYRRILHEPTAAAILRAQSKLAAFTSKSQVFGQTLHKVKTGNAPSMVTSYDNNEVQVA